MQLFIFRDYIRNGYYLQIDVTCKHNFTENFWNLFDLNIVSYIAANYNRNNVVILNARWRITNDSLRQYKQKLMNYKNW